MGNTSPCGNTGDRKRERAPTFDEASRYATYDGPGPWFVNLPDAVMPPRFAATGMASEKDIPEMTLPALLNKAVEANGAKPAFHVERPLPELVDGKPPAALPIEQWTTWTFAEYMADARKAAKGFVKLGFQQFESVNIWGFNSPEWVIGALASQFAGGKVAGLYPTDTGDTAAYKVVHSGGSVVMIEDRGKLTKLVKGLAARGDATRIKAIVAWGFEPTPQETVDIAGVGAVPVLSWTALLELGAQGDDAEIDRRIAATLPGHCAALIYTSGTTGDPKAVMISHDNILYEASCVRATLGKSVGFCAAASQERIVSYLPMSHVAGMMVDIVMPIVGTTGQAWVTTFFARSYDLKCGSLKDRLVAAKPTIFLGVPLVWEKIADKMRAIGAATTGTKKKFADWAKGKSLRRARGAQLGGSGEQPWGIGLSDVLLKKIKALLGLDECKFGMTGAAPIRVDTLEYFGQLGIAIHEVYGMSECAGAATWSLPEAHQWGSCGFELPGVEVRVFKVDEKDFNKKTLVPAAPSLDEIDEQYMGEICWRGRNNMMGYLANPDMGQAHVEEIRKKTAETIDSDGWLHSGDKGMITTRGMVKITGRYKELIIGDGGENIAPVPIEDSVKKLCDGVAEVMMIGDKRKYNVAFVTLKAVGANGEVPGTDDLDAGAKRVNPDVTTISGAMDDEKWIDAIRQAIKATNTNEKVCINNAFTIQKFCILPSNFSEENNELTPTKKLKRKVVETRYAAMIEKMYAGSGDYIRYSE